MLRTSLAILFGLFGAHAQSSMPCAACHREIVESYRQTGMGRSFGLPGQVAMPEDWTRHNQYFHAPSQSYFTMILRGGEYFQRRHQLDAQGREVNVLEKRIDYVLGSGNHARTYLHRTPQNQLLELPLGWYAEKSGYWAMNPGYDRPDHPGFRRPITYDCMFCHNSYPKIPPAAELWVGNSSYQGELPSGIQCERCHTGASQHARLAGSGQASKSAIRAAVLNPKRLSVERQLELCMSCHLESTSFPLPNSLPKYGRGPFSFRPGEALADFILNFDHAPSAGRGEKFEIVSAAYRMRQSACFLESKGQLTCTTCHDPHRVTQQPNQPCAQCHSSTLSSRREHSTQADCVQCHMPKRRTEDVIHVVMTDHKIQRRPPAGDLQAEREERRDEYRGAVVPYYPEKLSGPDAELYLALAQVKQRSNLAAGIAQLKKAITRLRPTRAAWYLDLAEALENNGQRSEALPWYREAVQRDRSAPTLLRWGTALRRAGRPTEALPILRQTAQLAPQRALAWYELALAESSLSDLKAAKQSLRRALQADPEMPEAHNQLGVVLATTETSNAELAFREAIRLQPEYAAAHANLARLLWKQGQAASAEQEFGQALRLDPKDSATRYDYAVMLGKQRRYDDAQKQLEEAVRRDANALEARELWADLLAARGQATAAVEQYRQVVARQPKAWSARLGLAAALASIGDRLGALAELRQVAAEGDASYAEKAKQFLRDFGAMP